VSGGAAQPAAETRAGPLTRWLWRGYLRRHAGLLAVALVLMAVEGAMLGALSWSMQPMFDRVFVGGETGAIALVAGLVGGAFLMRAAAAVLQRALIAQTAEQATLALQADLLAHLSRLDLGFFRRHPPGTLIERIRGDSAAVAAVLTGVLVPLGRDLVALVSLVAVTLAIDWRWTLAALLGAPLLVWPIVLLQRLVRQTSRTAREAAAVAATRLDEIFHGIAQVQLAGTEARETARFRLTVAGQIRAQVAAQTASAAIPAMMDVVAALGFAFVLAWGGAEIAGGTKTVGQFMAFFTAMALVFEPLRRLGGIAGALQGALAGLERMRALLDEPVRIASPPAARAAVAGDVVFDGVDFDYTPDEPVLRDLSFAAPFGTRTAIVGRSGAGKSTVLALLTRQADPQAGRITLAGQDLRDLDLAGLRRLYSVVTQDTALFDETIRDNILLGRGDVAPAALEAALDAARVTEFLPRLPRGLDTPAGPRGSALSGGQRQRVAIARAILRDAPILLLDEATSALDPANEAAVAGALDRLAAGRMTFVIAHRLATVQGADRILVLDRGRLVEAGRHADLMAAGGVYAALAGAQFAG
jgi:ABC-type multidrug transport system fused ATPase/permease subunit